MCKYKKWYNQIIEKYADVGDTFEQHHIQPKSMGGSDDESNLVNVSPRVHFILHQLLYRMTKGEDKRKMYYAVLLMGHSREVRTGAHYQLLREKQGDLQSKRMKGKTPWNKGVKGYKINQKPQKGIPKVTSYKKIMLDGVVYDSCLAAKEATGRSHYYLQKHGTYITSTRIQS